MFMPQTDQQMLGIDLFGKNDNLDTAENTSELKISDKDEPNSVMQSSKYTDANEVSKMLSRNSLIMIDILTYICFFLIDIRIRLVCGQKLKVVMD